ncbi:MAG: TlpA family protein disulfide reductase [Rhodocyclaceae bacterium]|nr:TlpA family protein disulfide reductase [Rhodocyclaceae bacterium]
MTRLLAASALALFVAGAAWADEDASALLQGRYPDLSGQSREMASLKGKPTVVNFWARWCGPCRKEIPELNALAAQHTGALNVIGVAVEELGESARDFAIAYEITYPLVFAGVGDGLALMRALGNELAGLPFTLILDAEGRIVGRKTGAMSGEEMAAAVAPLL